MKKCELRINKKMQGFTLQNTKFKKYDQTMWYGGKKETYTTDQKEWTEGFFRETLMEVCAPITKKFHKIYMCGTGCYWVVIEGVANRVYEIDLCDDSIDKELIHFVGNMTAKEKKNFINN